MAIQSLAQSQLKCALKQFTYQLDIKPVDKTERKKNKTKEVDGVYHNGLANKLNNTNNFQLVGSSNSQGDASSGLSNGNNHFYPRPNGAWDSKKPSKDAKESFYAFNNRQN